MRYRETGELHKDFHGALNTTVDYVVGKYGRDALREILEAARQRLLQTEDQPGRHPDLIYLDQVLSAGRKDQPESALTSHLLILALLRKLEEESRPGIRKVINATGAILHTNLGAVAHRPYAGERKPSGDGCLKDKYGGGP